MEHIGRQPLVFFVSFTLLFNVCESQFDLDNLDNLDLDNLDLGSLAKALSPECKYKCKNGKYNTCALLICFMYMYTLH